MREQSFNFSPSKQNFLKLSISLILKIIVDNSLKPHSRPSFSRLAKFHAEE